VQLCYRLVCVGCDALYCTILFLVQLAWKHCFEPYPPKPLKTEKYGPNPTPLMSMSDIAIVLRDSNLRICVIGFSDQFLRRWWAWHGLCLAFLVNSEAQWNSDGCTLAMSWVRIESSAIFLSLGISLQEAEITAVVLTAMVTTYFVACCSSFSYINSLGRRIEYNSHGVNNIWRDHALCYT